MTYVFDGTYLGFLTAVFERFDHKHTEAIQLCTADSFMPTFFGNAFDVVTNKAKAERVIAGLERIDKSIINEFYKAFLSEDTEVWNAVFNIIQQLFLGNSTILQNFGDANVLQYDHALTKIRRESHRMKAFIRFQKSSDGLFYALVEPDFNVLPLIADFFKKRYADQSWLIYDLRRKYGIFYNLHQVNEVELSKEDTQQLQIQTTPITLDEKEQHFQELWKQYFKSTNIAARKNMKLHIKNVPKRYWKFLVEKQNI